MIEGRASFTGAAAASHFIGMGAESKGDRENFRMHGKMQ
jgi:hypothetical protein